MKRPQPMTNDAKPRLTPKLRFPEFRDQPGWDETILGSVLTEHGEKNDGSSEVHSVSVHKGVINQIEHLGRSFAAADRSNYNLAKPHDIIYTKSPTGDFPWGVVKQNRLPYNVIVSPLYGVFSPVNRHLGYILDAYFESPIRTTNYLAPITQKGAKNTIQISNATFLSKGLYLPSSDAEHKKIADCLCSLDELIGAEGRQLDALKAHKKGLMQQLFPREGETCPRLRLPEFRGKPEWEKANLGQVADFESGGTPSKQNPAFWDGSTPWASAKDMKMLFLDDTEDHITTAAVDAGAKVVPAGTVLMLTRGMTLFNDVPICVPLRPMSFNQDVKALRAKGGLKSGFLPYLLLGNRQRLLSMVDAAGHGTGRLNTDELRSLIVMHPQAAEQQRIVECLSALESIISAQSNEVAALKTHKKGLMQQLFPSPTEAEA